MHTDPQVRGRDAKRCEIARISVQRDAVQQQRRDENHHSDANLAADRAGRRSDGQQNQGRLGGYGVVIVAISDEDIEGNQGEQKHSQHLDRNR